MAAVVSGGGDQCEGIGVAGRVSAVYDDFIAPVVAGQEQRITCGECVAAAVSPAGDCASATQACLDDTRCKALVDCYDGCETERCREGCTAAHVESLPKYAAIKACLCQAPCADECADSSICTAAGVSELCPDACPDASQAQDAPAAVDEGASGSPGSSEPTGDCRAAGVGVHDRGASFAVTLFLAGCAISRRNGTSRARRAGRLLASR